MYYQPEAMLEQYDIEIKQITKGRGVFCCETDQGKKVLAPFRGSAERAKFVREILCSMQEKGYPVEQVSLTKDGQCVVTDESGMRFWLKDLVEGNECQTGREKDVAAGAQALAGFHCCVSSCITEIPDFMKNTKNEPAVLYYRHYRELILVKNFVQSRKTRNEFERSFWEQYTHYIAQAKEAVGMLQERKDQGRTRGFCHGDCNQHNMLRTAQGVRLVNYENLFYGEQMVDLANYLRKILEKNSWSTDMGKHILEAYEKQRKLCKEEKQLLHVLLLFPEKFWKVSNHYSNSHKVWVSGRDIEKLNRLIAAEPAREHFLENLFSFL